MTGPSARFGLCSKPVGSNLAGKTRKVSFLVESLEGFQIQVH